MIKKTTLLLLVMISLATSANAVTRYVSDKLYTFIHVGPGTKYKILGSVRAGDHLQLIQNKKQDGFIKVKDSKGRTGWINARFVSKQMGVKERLTNLEIKHAKLNIQVRTEKDQATLDISSLTKKVKTHSAQVSELKSSNQKLTEELERYKVLNNDLNGRLDTEKTDLLIRWFTYGGMVAGLGLLVGLIIPSLMPIRRKKNRW